MTALFPFRSSFFFLALHPSVFARSAYSRIFEVFHSATSFTKISIMASSGRTTAVSGGTGIESTPANNIGGDANRRGSNSGGLFSGLMNQKRNSTDAAAAARRQSFHDQKPAVGFIGKMWHNFTNGSPENK